MTPKLSSDVEQCVSAAPDGAVQVLGTGGTTYWVLTEEAMRVRQYVQQGIAEADKGELSEWDSDAIKAAGRVLKQSRSN